MNNMTLSQKIEETISKYPEVDKDIIKLIVIDVVEFMKEQGREEFTNSNE